VELKDEAAEMWNSHDLIVKNRDLNHKINGTGGG
jgi:hypothetical protein